MNSFLSMKSLYSTSNKEFDAENKRAEILPFVVITICVSWYIIQKTLSTNRRINFQRWRQWTTRNIIDVNGREWMIMKPIFRNNYICLNFILLLENQTTWSKSRDKMYVTLFAEIRISYLICCDVNCNWHCICLQILHDVIIIRNGNRAIHLAVVLIN